MKRTALALLALSSFAFVACAAPSSDDASSTEAAISDSKVKLPAGDPCRDVLAPLALGLADSAVGLDYAKSVTVSLTSETDTRLYTVQAVAPSYTASFEVELDNDSASKCWLLSATMNNDAKLAGDAKSKMKHSEADFSAPVSVIPTTDDCIGPVALVANAARIATGGSSAQVTFTGEDENRYYTVHVVSGAYGYDFDLETSNDSASKCWVQDLEAALPR